MKVLIVTGSLNERSGWGRHTRAVVDQLIVQGMEVSVCTEVIANAPCRMTKITPLRSWYKAASLVFNMLIVRRAARNVDVIHAIDGWPYGVYGWFATIGTSKRLFTNGVGTYSIAPLYSRSRGWLLRRAYAKASRIFCISDYTKRQLEHAGIPAEKLTIVLHGATRQPEISDLERTNFAAKYSISNERHPIILTVGAIKDRKGQLETLKAVELLKVQYPSILYVALGSSASNYAVQMRSYADTHSLGSNLLIVSDANDRALSYFYSTCDVFALNSNTDEIHHHFEGFGLVVVEAYQFGKPAVGSRDCGIESAIEDGATGYLTNQRDPEDIAEKIQTILDSYDVFSKNARAGYNVFDWKKTVETYVRIYSAKA